MDHPAKGLLLFPARGSARTPESPRRIARYLLVGALVVYLSQYTGAVVFYYQFQKTFEDSRSEKKAEITWAVPAEVGSGERTGWLSIHRDGIAIPVPPGPPALTRNGNRIMARLADGEFSVSSYGAGFVSAVLRERMDRLGVPSDEPLSDIEALETIASESAEGYRFGYTEKERQLYAARLLAKLLLFEEGRVDRFEISRRDEPLETAVLIEYATGRIRVYVARADDVLVGDIHSPPPAWKTVRAADWLTP